MLAYAAPAWGACADTHLRKLQAILSKTLRTIANAPWFVRNITLHRDLEIELLQEFIQKRVKKTY